MAQRVRCFFDIEVEGIPSGRIIFELFNDVCPKTCENFRVLCTGEMGDGKVTGKPLHYRGVKFHRVIKYFMIQSGDFSAGNGTGGESIYGGQFEDESFDIHHDEPFLLSMANRGKDTNGSQFFITTQPSPHLDGKHVVFGRVVSGQDVVAAIEDLPVDNRSRPLQPAVISNCGELILLRSNKAKEKKVKKKKVASSDSDSDAEKKKKKKKKEKKQKKHKKAKSSDEEGEVKDDEENLEGANTTVVRPHPLVFVSCINPEEIPDVPKNRFLYRAGPEKDRDQAARGDRGRARVRAYTKSGRKVKGRGSLRYRTPSRSRSRSRSVTPPHWRQAQKRTISYDVLQKRSDEKQKRDEERQVKQQEREQEIEERRRRREERHKELEGNERKSFEGDYRPQGSFFPRMRGNWQHPRDRIRDRREEQSWRNGRDRRDNWRQARGRGDDDHVDARDKIRQKQDALKDGSSDSDHSIKKEEEETNEETKFDQAANLKEDAVKVEKNEILDETALDYEVMDNEFEEDEEEDSKETEKGGSTENSKAFKKSPKSDIEEKEEKNTQQKEIGKSKADDKRGNKDERSRSRSRGGFQNRSRDRRDRSRDKRNRSRDRRNSKDRNNHRDRSRDKRGRSRDRRDRSRDRRGRSRDRDRRGRSRDRSERSRDRNRRSRDRKDRSRDRKDRSQDRRDRSRDKKSSSRDKGRSRRRGSASSSSSDSD